MPFLDSLDIANRSCQHLGVPRISSPTEDSVNNAEITFAYDKLRRAELRRNVWRFAKKKAVLRPIGDTTFLFAPAQWNAGIQYLPGSVVADENGLLWVSNQANNLGNDPNLTNVWQGYYGSMTVDVYDGTQTYFAGDLVYKPRGSGGYNIYLSRQNNNTEDPSIPDLYSSTATYQQDEVVVDIGNNAWRSLIALNNGNPLVNPPANWVATQTYAAGIQVTGTDGFIYTSFSNGNLGNNPVTDNNTFWLNTLNPAAWTEVPLLYPSSSLWTPIYGAMESFNFVYPIGYGPVSQEMTKNVFRLPANFLRVAPQDPKAGINSFLGAPAYNTQNDWLLEGNFLLSQCATPIIFPFIADVSDVSEMDDLFCEGFAARVAVETCETITNSNAKQQTINSAYQKFMGEARIVNSIETGPVEPPEDDYITCRL